MTAPDTPPANTLIPVRGIVATFPDPQDLRRELRLRLEAEFARARQAQGEIHVPEDTYDLQRKLAAVREALEAYGRAFADAGKQVRGMQQEQLVDAVGEQDGIPNQGLTVPDPEGDVRLSLEHVNAREFDLDQLVGVVAIIAAGQWPQVDSTRSPTALAALAIGTFLELGKFEPQVTKVKAYAAQVARQGSDDLASVLTGAIQEKDPAYKGIKFERKSP